MKNKDLRLKERFEEIIENHINGNIIDCKAAIKKLNKLDLIRFVNHLHRYVGTLYIDVNGSGELDLFSTR